MVFYMFYMFQIMYNCSLGWGFMRIEKRKPKFRIFYYSSDEYSDLRKNMEF